MAEVFGERRKQLLRHLLRNGTGATVKELMQVLGVTRTAVRQHVEALMREGLVAPAAALPSGGRPRTLFALTAAGRDAVRRHYAWFGELLMDAVERERDATGLRTRVTRIAAAVVARARAQRSLGAEESNGVERLAALMDQLGYDARVAKDADGAPAIEANHCIFHELAMKRPAICQFDLAVLSGYAGRRVELRECMSRGGRVCRFRFTPRAS
ncbi:MAG TPA: winged helix-turn-helix transcriptional regulator [Gammaproteobacteria bacterium]